MKKARDFKGNHPGEDTGFELVSIVNHEGINWHFYKREGSEYNNVKIVAEDKAPRKANYWISLHVFRYLLVDNSDLKTIEKKKPLRDEAYRILGVYP